MSPLVLGDLDSKLAEALKPLLLRAPRTASTNPLEPNPVDPPLEWRAASEQAKTIGPLRDRTLGWMGVLLILAFPIGIFLPLVILASTFIDNGLFGGSPPTIPLHPVITLLITSILTMLSWWYIRFALRHMEQASLQHYFTSGMLHALRPMLTLSPMEEEYLDAVGAILKVDKTDSAIGSNTARDLLTSLNELLTAGRRLEQEQATLSEAQAGQSLAQIEAERDALAQRIAATSDSVARETLSESLALCERRLARAQKLAPLKERIEAQLDGITQTIRSVQGSVASLRLVPKGAELEELQASARNLVQRTNAIENAVQEVLHLG